MKNEISLHLIENAVIGMTEKVDTFVRAAKEHQIIPIQELVAHKNNYKGWFNNKGKLKAQILKNEIFLLQGQDGDHTWLLGDRLNYINDHQSYRELGYKSMNELFEDKDFPISKAKGYAAMAINIRFSRNNCIMLGSKAHLLVSLVDDIGKRELGKLMTQIAKMSYREAQEFLMNYKKYLKQSTEIEYEEQKIVNLSGDKIKEQIIVNFTTPELKIKGRTIELNFEEEWEEQVYALALRNSEKAIQREIINILNSEEFEGYRKQALKKYGKND